MACIFGIGNPLLDIVMRATHERLDSIGAPPGSMNLVEYQRQHAIIADGEAPSYSPGEAAPIRYAASPGCPRPIRLPLLIALCTAVRWGTTQTPTDSPPRSPTQT